MMQSCASAAKLRSGGPILPVGMKAKGRLGNSPPRTVIGVPSQADGQAETVVVPSACSLCRTQNNAVRDNALPHEPPQGDQSLRAKATIMGFRVPRAFRCGIETTSSRRCPLV